MSKPLDLDALAAELREHDACCGKGMKIYLALLNEARRLQALLDLEERHHAEHAAEPAYRLPGERRRIVKDAGLVDADAEPARKGYGSRVR